MGFQVKRKKNIIYHTIKYGKLLPVFPIYSFFLLYPHNENKMRCTELIGTLVKKKFQKSRT